MEERAHDRARRAVTIDHATSLPERLDALWDAWIAAFPDLTARLATSDGNVIAMRRRQG